MSRRDIGVLLNTGAGSAVCLQLRRLRQRQADDAHLAMASSACGSLPESEESGEVTFGVPWFKHDSPGVIRQYAAAYRKVAEQAEQRK